jgi:hypothetical protein
VECFICGKDGEDRARGKEIGDEGEEGRGGEGGSAEASGAAARTAGAIADSADYRARRPNAQPEECFLRDSLGHHDGDHRGERLREILAGL